ncbi:MAG: hypothetical protein FWD73_14335 [Polyangiaceae bacterium]|nr:hypothetical protein [Polyangiaceae bacterium]
MAHASLLSRATDFGLSEGRRVCIAIGLKFSATKVALGLFASGRLGGGNALSS